MNCALNFDDPQPCATCGKVPFASDAMMAANKTWHKLCFKCHTCAALLTKGKESVHQGWPYCKKCYDDNYNPNRVRITN